MRDGFQIQNTFGGKPSWLIRQAFKRGHKQAGGQMHHKTEGHLNSNQRMHQPAARMRIFAASQRARPA